jgi:hypothetical protein
MPSFPQLLLGIAASWKDDRENIDLAGAQLTAQLQTEASMATSGKQITSEEVKKSTARMLETYDWQNGGWGAAPKFPQAMAIEFLLRTAPTPNPEILEGYSPASGRGELNAPLHALDAMARGGIYDVVGGGFARYSTDNNWLIPHFD